jgi:hypothetical protein
MPFTPVFAILTVYLLRRARLSQATSAPWRPFIPDKLDASKSSPPATKHRAKWLRGAGAAGIGTRMFDRAHLSAAQRLIARTW